MQYNNQDLFANVLRVLLLLEKKENKDILYLIAKKLNILRRWY